MANGTIILGYVMQRVNCQAIVDIIKEPKMGNKGLATYRVETWGKEPYDFVRIYEIAAKSDTLAAQEGIRRFVDELSLIHI